MLQTLRDGTFIEDETYFAAGIADVSAAQEILLYGPWHLYTASVNVYIMEASQILTATNGTY